MPNMQAITTSHNKAVFAKTNKSESTTTQKKKCNCRKKESCPLSGKCLTESVVYQATVTKEDGSATETYVGLTEGTFKSHFLSHIYIYTIEQCALPVTTIMTLWQLVNLGTRCTVQAQLQVQVSSLFLDNLHTTIKHTHPQVAKLIEAGMCLSKVKEKYKSINRIVMTIINIAYTCTRVT